ncbi:MAG: dihydrofolate reductase family protein, partial [Pseudonocardia sp.]|nr:dihydrofolate reductase family protein [Pseudonocardia sp.]
MTVYVVASVAVSLDGCIDDAGPDRLVLSNAADLDRVDEVRAGVDAILVGAGTVRRDDPSLTVRDYQPPVLPASGSVDPVRVILGAVDPGARVQPCR